jgi:hypothetical protein
VVDSQLSAGTHVRYQVAPGGIRLVFWLIAGFVAVFVMLALVLFAVADPVAALIVLAVALLDGGIFWAVMPRRFVITDTALVVVLGGPLRWRFPLATITEVERVPPRRWNTLSGIKFVTSSGKTVIVRRAGRRLKLVISPDEPERFVDELRAALAEAPR